MTYRWIIAVFVIVVATCGVSVYRSLGAQKGQDAPRGAATGRAAGTAKSGAVPTTPGVAQRPGATSQTAPVQGPSEPTEVVQKNSINPNRFDNSLSMGGVNGNSWLNDMGARQQLQLTPQQYNQLSRAYRNAWSQYQESLNALPQNLTPAERQQRMLELQSRFSHNYNRALEATFSNRRLRQRYRQLDRQFQGLTAFSNPLVRERMGLTPAQIQQLNALTEQWRQQMAALRAQLPNDPAGLQFAKLQQRFQQQIGSILTPQQQQMWSEMIGQTYDFPWAVYNPNASTATTNTSQPVQPPRSPLENTSPGSTEQATSTSTPSGASNTD